MLTLPLQSIIGLSLLSLAPLIVVAANQVKTTDKDGFEIKMTVTALSTLFLSLSGLIAHFEALGQRRAQRSGAFALLAANAGLAYHLFYGRSGLWEDALLYTVLPAFGGLIAGALDRHGASDETCRQNKDASKMEASVKALEEEVKLLKESCDTLSRKWHQIDPENSRLKQRIETAWDRD
ncbi:Hypothetical protein R9X50_00408300 [Acrodontium crateriforme]|uniref:Uncharacterized protein n=1 Tax=Acrodontium crateriforme TaxID=150365 RepID=A0AAQ3R9X9_9PEZI|nr:Hypothetical protein R9X50_00408300 [Acrodontium crateriforme]